MSLANQTCWVVGGVGVVGKGIVKGLLQAGAVVIVNSRSVERLTKLKNDLDYPDDLITVHGSLLPGYAAKTISSTLADMVPLHHVVAHGAVRNHGNDETNSVMRPMSCSNLLQLTKEEFSMSASHLASLHFSAAQEFIPRLQQFSSVYKNNGISSSSATNTTNTYQKRNDEGQIIMPSYTFVTGDGSGHPTGKQSAFGEINSYHMWGLSSVFRHAAAAAAASSQSASSSNTHPDLGMINCREVRITAEMNNDYKSTPLSDDIGKLTAGVVSNSNTQDDNGTLLEVLDESTLDSLLAKYSIKDETSRMLG